MKDCDIVDVRVGGLTGKLYSSRRPVDAPGDSALPFVLLHGIGVSHRYLSRLHQALAASTDIHSIDLPGFGATPNPDNQLSVADYAAFLLAGLDSAGVGTCVLVGHSMGAQFAVEAALQQPDRVSHLVLMGPVVDPRRRTVLHQAVDLTIDGLFFESTSSNFLVFTDYLRCGPRRYLAELRVMMEYRLEERIEGLTTPVLVLRGARDPVSSHEWCRQLANRVPDGRLTEVPKCGHVVQHTGTFAVAEAIRTFTGVPARKQDEQL